MVGRHHEERTLEQTGAPQPREQLPDEVVRVAHLEQMAQVVVDGQVGVAEAHVVVDVQHRVLARGAALAPGRQVDPGLVRKQRMVEVERRPRSLPHLSEPLVEARRASTARQPV